MRITHIKIVDSLYIYSGTEILRWSLFENVSYIFKYIFNERIK